MKPFNHHSTLGGTKRHLASLFMALGAVLAVGSAQAQTTLTLAATNLFGGAGDQRATAVGISGGALYLSGVAAANAGDGLVVSYALPMANNAAPVWSALWPGLTGADDFSGLSVSTSGVYVAGSSFNRTTDSVGGKENKGITVKFPLNGPTGGGFGGAIWDRQTPAAPGALPYGGSESLWASLLTVEGGGTFAYVTGVAQQNGANGGRLFISKLDASGIVLWTRDDSASIVANAYSIGRGLAALNGNVYVSGLNADNGNRGYLRKYDASGNLLWSHTNAAGQYVGATALGGAIFAVGQVGTGASANFLVDKWDEAGNLIWSQQYDRNNSEDTLNAVVALNGRIYAAGATRGTTSGGADAAVLEIDPATGNLLATTIYGGAQDEFANGLATDGTDLYVVGETRSFTANGNTAGQNDAFVARYTVRPLLTSFAISPVNPVIGVGSNQQFIATGTFSDGSSRALIGGGGAWITNTPIPAGGTASAVGGVISNLWYVAGGSPPGGFSTTKLQVYNPVTDTWTLKSPAGILRSSASAGVISNKLYVAGGAIQNDYNNPTTSLEIYNPASDSWTTGAPMSAGRPGAASAAIGRKLYVAGGQGTFPYNAVSTLEIYDTVTDSWSIGAPLPIAVGQAVGAAINGKFYVSGGTRASGGVDLLTAALQIYDPANNSWSSGAAMLAPRVDASGSVVDGKLYVAGGHNTNYGIVTTPEIYDPVLNVWTMGASEPFPRTDAIAAAIGSKLFVAGGVTGGSTIGTLEVYTPSEVTWSSGTPGVATINSNGLATGISVGSSTITATTALGSTNTFLTVVVPPNISTQPMNATAAGNGSVTLSVTASGGGLSYQWRLNGTNIAGATGSMLTLNNLNASQAGAYTVVVSNAVGNVTSSAATLSLLNLNMFAGLTIVGQLGGNYQIDFRNDLNNTNWFNLTNVVLPSSPYLFIDTASPQYPRRFYRAVLVP